MQIRLLAKRPHHTDVSHSDWGGGLEGLGGFEFHQTFRSNEERYQKALYQIPTFYSKRRQDIPMWKSISLFLVFFWGGWGGRIFSKLSDPKQNDISKHCTKSQKCSSKITKVTPSQSFHKCGTNERRTTNDINPARLIVLSKWNFVETKTNVRPIFFLFQM